MLPITMPQASGSSKARRSETCRSPSTMTARNTSTPPNSKAAGGTCNASNTGAGSDGFIAITAYTGEFCNMCATKRCPPGAPGRALGSTCSPGAEKPQRDSAWYSSVADRLRGLDHLRNRRQRELLEVGSIGHRHVLGRHTHDWCVKPIKSLLHQACGDLGADAL